MFKVAAGWGKLHEVNKRRKGEEESERVTRERDLGGRETWWLERKREERGKEGRGREERPVLEGPSKLVGVDGKLETKVV